MSVRSLLVPTPSVAADYTAFRLLRGRALLLLDLRVAAASQLSAGLKCHTDYRRSRYDISRPRPVQRSDPVVSAFNSVPSLSSSAVHTSMYFFVASRDKRNSKAL